MAAGHAAEAVDLARQAVGMFKDLFPGPLIIEEGPSTMHSFGGGPDPLILDMLSDLHGGFQDDVLPMLHSAAAAMRERAWVSAS